MFPPKNSNSVRRNLPENVIVAVKGDEKIVSKASLAWALDHAVHPGDCVILLAVYSDLNSGRKLLSWKRLNGDCRNSDDCVNLPDRICQISESCSRMVLQFQNKFEVMVQIKVVSGTPAGAVAAQAKYNAASWVILDKKLKQELKHCMKELHCNIVVMKGSEPKVLKLNLGRSDELQTPFFSADSSPSMNSEKLLGHGVNHSTPVSSPEETASFCPKPSDKNLLSNYVKPSVFFVYKKNPLYEGLIKGKPPQIIKSNNNDNPHDAMDSCGERVIALSLIPKAFAKAPQNNNTMTGGPKDKIFSSGIREAVSLGRALSLPPPLCSLCQYQAPALVKPLRQFCYSELQEATDGFSDSSFVAEGELWVVYKGVLKDGLVVAIKQSKFSDSHGDVDFCKEVRVLSCAQHKNVVLLVGFCIERDQRLLVYEYVCNGSLDIHLHVSKRTYLDWPSRLKIAIGTATGLRYLHEDCRVGCIVHRDMRPKNILLTHDYEPLVADFGLVSLHTEQDTCDEERVIGTSGYLAPEYFNGGIITEKVDIYAFGLVLLELITGRRTIELQCYKARNFWHDVYASHEMEPVHFLAYKHNLLDTRLGSYQPYNFPPDLHAIGYAASLCLQKDPESRPPMSKVLKVLEGETRNYLGLDLNSAGNRSGHLHATILKSQTESRGHYRKLSC
ncbi:protein kinase domain-containing protein [Artemisia annua]|uniref:non-specific serine/threonine protein kinase n=1 Tax=Artemisia annua TaxID=35608 RepID=A0A2U1PEW4_ARTAN|nr:protein kinase domain-containing protein [Artemisia annua]